MPIPVRWCRSHAAVSPRTGSLRPTRTFWIWLRHATFRSAGPAGPEFVIAASAVWFPDRSSTDRSRWTSPPPAIFSFAALNRPATSSSTCDSVCENNMQRSDLARWAVVPMRVLAGYGFIEHGFSKLSRGPDVFAGILGQLGVPLPHVAAWLTIGTELFGGLALLLGAVVAWVSIPTALILLGAMATVH